MKVGGLLTSAGINIGLCVLFLSLYSILRKQPQNVKVYFGRRIAEEHNRLRDAFILERFVPSPSWIVKSLRCTEEEILATAGLDAVVFNRIIVFRYLHFYFNMFFFSFWLLLKVAANILCSSFVLLELEFISLYFGLQDLLCYFDNNDKPASFLPLIVNKRKIRNL